MNSLRTISLLAMGMAGMLHILAAPSHMTHMTIHGLALLLFGLLQLVWVVGAWRWWNRTIMLAGIALSVGLVLLWLLLYFMPAPPSAHLLMHARQLDWMLISTKLLEGVAGGVLFVVYADRVRVRETRPWSAHTALPTLLVGATTGTILYFTAINLQTYFPEVSHHTGWPTGQMFTDLRRTPLALTVSGETTSTSTANNEYDWQLPRGFPLPRVPEDNPMRAEVVELGRHLFYDTRLSGNQTQSCESCHLQALAFTDGRATPIGSTGHMLERNSPALVNVAYNPTLTWANPVLTQLERQVLVPMFGEFPVELGMAGYENEILDRLRADAKYPSLFAAAFPDDPEPINIHNIVQALSAFIRSLISGDSPYDRYLAGNKEELSLSAQRGMDLFFGEELECHHCHTGFNFSISTIHANSTFSAAVFQNNGLYNLDGAGAYPQGNRGVYEITGNPEDMGRFRPPTLRNISLTAPYMHDGSLASLEDVVRHYMAGGRVIETGPLAGDGRRNPYKNGLVSGFELTDQEIADLIAFLESLTDEGFITDPRFSNPFE
ncbi:MAG: di-heme enzyme [Chloroflexi bacterium]|nr:di-heme enzyme [Chloroflexota bacterium]